jgi:membrane protease YdiL (CAAX protease family)
MEFLLEKPRAVLVAAGSLAALLLAGLALDVFLGLRCRRDRPAWRQRARDFRLLPWNWQEAGALVLLMIWLHALLIVFSSLGLHWRWLTRDQVTRLALVAQSLVFPCIGLTVLRGFMRAHGLSWSRAFGLERGTLRPHLRRGFAFYLASLPPIIAASLLYFGLLTRLSYPIRSQEIVRLLLDPAAPRWLHVYAVAIAVTVAPFAEEVFFRGLALPALAKLMGTLRAMLATSLLFALAHFHVPSVAPLFVTALCFSAGYVASGSILVPVLMHACFNAVNIALLLLVKDALPLGLIP